MNYAEFEKLPVSLDNVEDTCIYKKRQNNKIHSNKCIDSDIYNSKINEYMIDSSSIDECKLIYNNRIENNVVSNKNNKQLNTRPIKTIPYRNYTEFTYNPELEILINSGLHTNSKKSVSNTSEVETSKTPMIKYVKNRIDTKNNSFDISRFQLSSRQIKGNKKYIKSYKKNLRNIKKSLIQEE